MKAKRKLTNILQALYVQPWAIKPEMHTQLCSIVEKHVSGEAHNPKGIVDQMPNPEATDTPEPLYEALDGIAVISISGVIGKRVGALERSSGVTDIDRVSRALKEIDEDPELIGALLDIDSPGGSITGLPELCEEIRAFSKPLVSYSDSTIASAAYWIASQSDAIYVSRSSDIGSIGVYIALLDKSKAYEMAGLRVDLIRSGEHKGMGLEGTSLSDEQRSMLQASVDQSFNWFKADVLEMRSIKAEDMQGQSFFGEDALAKNFVDRIGTLQDALQEIRDLANIGV